jgi:hypothetical protein
MPSTDQRTTLLPPLVDGLYVFVAVLAATLALFFIVALLTPASASSSLVQRTDKLMRHTQHCERLSDRDRSPTPSRRLYARTKAHPAFRNWAWRLWNGRAHRACGKVRYLNADPVRAIRYVFQRVAAAAQAIAVSSCETGGAFNTTATNGQFVNLFQMGYNERRRYGWHVAGSPPLDAAWPAFFYFIDSGRDWSPWSCKPW